MLDAEAVTPDQVNKLYFDTERDILHMKCQLIRNTGDSDSDRDKLELLRGFTDLNSWLRPHT